MFSRNKFTSISVHDLYDLLGKIDLIDIRETCEYNSGHIPTATNVPIESILAQPERYLDKSKKYHIICQSGGRSSRACDELTSKGYNVINVAGGTGSYIRTLEI
ncbi:Rhodanese-related sulfurtransferase [Clostridium cavendishii DSM 21758]|uniref:Rhodanese-related sulfurtransferase n=1 Tax=Clostridium cavendishii DSM 21758 TaxID=1121302 RepID=A0A1M6FCE9_9CLOT|nr:Rhodanese-related sulfurtransferase [Clostridium cavendishii DSM 21758]